MNRLQKFPRLEFGGGSEDGGVGKAKEILAPKKNCLYAKIIASWATHHRRKVRPFTCLPPLSTRRSRSAIKSLLSPSYSSTNSQILLRRSFPSPFSQSRSV